MFIEKYYIEAVENVKKYYKILMKILTILEFI